MVFADLAGSMAMFQTLGNARASTLVTHLTHWISDLCLQNGGRLIKTLGDGVLLAFQDAQSAARAAILVQRQNQEGTHGAPRSTAIRIKIGMSHGEVLEQNGDYYGEAVNTAKSLSDISGDDQILICDQVADQLAQTPDIRTRPLGPMHIRGKREAVPVSRIEWQQAAATDFMTMPADLGQLVLPAKRSGPTVYTLSWLQTTLPFKISEKAIYIGRHTDASFVVDHPRVSRMHARIFSRHNTLILEDLSTYGTWVRFAGGSSVVALRREECALTGMCDISLGGPPDSTSCPNLRFLLKDRMTF